MWMEGCDCQCNAFFLLRLALNARHALRCAAESLPAITTIDKGGQTQASPQTCAYDCDHVYSYSFHLRGRGDVEYSAN